MEMRVSAAALLGGRPDDLPIPGPQLIKLSNREDNNGKNIQTATLNAIQNNKAQAALIVKVDTAESKVHVFDGNTELLRVDENGGVEMKAGGFQKKRIPAPSVAGGAAQEFVLNRPDGSQAVLRVEEGYTLPAGVGAEPWSWLGQVSFSLNQRPGAHSPGYHHEVHVGVKDAGLAGREINSAQLISRVLNNGGDVVKEEQASINAVNDKMADLYPVGGVSTRVADVDDAAIEQGKWNALLKNNGEMELGHRWGGIFGRHGRLAYQHLTITRP